MSLILLVSFHNIVTTPPSNSRKSKVVLFLNLLNKGGSRDSHATKVG